MKLVTKKASDGFPPGLAGTWVEGCEWQFGIPDKQYSTGNALLGFGCHSMVGTLEGSYGRLFSREKDGNRYSDYAAVSWHFSNPKEGKLIQHYPLGVSCWCHGSRGANTAFLAMEMEGGYDPFDEPLTVSQTNNCIELWTALERELGLGLFVGATLLQHKELVAVYGGQPTACASDRYADVWNMWADGVRIPQKPEEEEPMIDEALRKAMISRERLRFYAYTKKPGFDESFQLLALASNPDIELVYAKLEELEAAGLIRNL